MACPRTDLSISQFTWSGCRLTLLAQTDIARLASRSSSCLRSTTLSGSSPSRDALQSLHLHGSTASPAHALIPWFANVVPPPPPSFNQKKRFLPQSAPAVSQIMYPRTRYSETRYLKTFALAYLDSALPPVQPYIFVQGVTPLKRGGGSATLSCWADSGFVCQRALDRLG